MAHYTQDCVEAREARPDPRDATIAQQRDDILALIRYIESCDVYETVRPIIERYRKEGAIS